MMPLFASPDFGAGAMAACMLLLFFLGFFLVVGIVGALVIRSFWPQRAQGSQEQGATVHQGPLAGCFSVLLCGVVVSVLGTCLLPPVIFSLYFRRGPADPNRFSVEPGMTTEEVTAKYGQPHAKYVSEDGEEGWNYHTDRWGCGIGFIHVRFDRNGRVTGSSYH
jgi:hypothetical protein